MRYDIHRFDSVTSTNDIAIRMADNGASEGTVVVAREQTQGRGRRGRSWASPTGGLYLSVILRPDIPFADLWHIAFMGSLASAQAIRAVSGLPAGIKWPNDVLLNGRKVCGLLAEAPNVISDLRPVVLGIGINVNSTDFPPEIADTATSIAREIGRQFPVSELEACLLGRLNDACRRYADEGFPPIMVGWRELDCTVGRRVSINGPDGTANGTAVEVDSDGSLVVETEDAGRIRITAGEVLFRPI